MLRAEKAQDLHQSVVATGKARERRRRRREGLRLHHAPPRVGRSDAIDRILCYTHVAGETIATAEFGSDQVMFVAERPAQRRDLHLQIVLPDHGVRPHSAEKLVLRYEAPAGLDEDQEQIEGTGGEVDRL